MATLISGGSPSLTITDAIDGGGPADEFVDTLDGNGPTGPDFPTTPPVIVREDTRRIWLESMDGSLVVPLNVDVDRILKAGATGLQLPPLDVVTIKTPGMPGSSLQEVNVDEREVFLPLKFASDTSHADFMGKLTELRGLIAPMWDLVNVGDTGTFRLGVSSLNGERLLDVVYKDGWTGEHGGSAGGTRFENFGLTLLAVDPFFHAREYTSFTYGIADGEVFLSSTDDNVWPRSISASVTIGNGMQMAVQGDVPAWVEVFVDGPATIAELSFPGTNMVMTSSVADGQELILVTDPRRRSARLGGQVAWPYISPTSTFAPLRPGMNSVNVQLGSAGADTSMTVRWLERWLAAF
ncbi:hypothetical protein DEJ21_14295 [Curtobacterium sp. MCSS17_006]|uniref:phage distal tail protein n=1 Tax=Curtobacterium sp. MCSS17_006 TaxID=2175642 RepID=UPI000DAAB930|nr:hypothetical protein [Curtobacterium sp. MCSS17_006]PZE34016.1 hypothetical protein DEJ21_14295 [Curtobacterium sp. MCSS17_006]